MVEVCRYSYLYHLKEDLWLTGKQGNYPVKSEADIPAALEILKNRPLYAEKWVYFKKV
jgi:phosphoribosylaminoimidazole carboxylase